MPSGVVVVTGGAGYIGRSLVARLQAGGLQPVVIDRRPMAVAGIQSTAGDIRDPHVWLGLRDYAIRAVFHLAGRIQVAESVADPARYFDDNVVAGLQMLHHLRMLGNPPVVFSSSAAVYGAPLHMPIAEATALNPLSPYGVSKRHFEEVLAAFAEAYGLSYVALRYFNAAGSYAGVGEKHEPETHLIPLAIDRIQQGALPIVYGRDYPTDDGTAVRDFVHISDLVEAHIQALHYLESGGRPRVFNVGAGHGVSVRRVVEAVAQALGASSEMRFADRRAGDPAVLVADIGHARRVLEWEPTHSSVTRIVSDAVGARAS